MTSNISALGWMLISAFCLAAMGALAHAVAEVFDWTAIVFARVFVNFLCVSALALKTHKALVFFSAPKHLWVRSITGTISSFGTFYGFTHLPVAESSCIFNTLPIWMALLVAFVSKERVSLSIWTGVGCGIMGVVLVLQPQFNEGNIAIIIALGGAFFASIAVYNLHLIEGVHPTTIVAHFSLVASLATFVAMLPSLHSVIEGLFESPEVVISLIGVGIIGAAAQLAMTRAYMLGNPTINSTVGLAQVVFAVVFDVVFWNRSFDIVAIIGIVLIMIPTVVFAGRTPFRNIRNQKRRIGNN